MMIMMMVMVMMMIMLQAKLAVRDIETGTSVRRIDIFDPKDATRIVASVKVRPLPPQPLEALHYTISSALG
jgi:hypothetical protein